MQHILIVGGSGTLGRELTVQLLAAGKKVRVLTRNPAATGALSAENVEIMAGDLLDPDSLLQACQGMDAVISAAHSMLGRGKYGSAAVDVSGQKALIDAAREAGVPYFIFSSIIGAAPDHACDFWRHKWTVEEYLKSSGLAWNIIRASAFMELHIHELMGKSILEKGKVTIFGRGENPTNFVSVKDVARLMVLCLNDPQRHNQSFEIGGLDNPTRREVVAMYAEHSGKPLKISHIPNGVLRVMSKLIKPFHPGLSRIMFVSDLIDRTDQRFDVRPLLRIFPLELTRVADFVRSRFQAPPGSP